VTLLALGVTAAAAGAAAGTPPARPWPLDLPPVLTSTFGEFRSNHLHAGIDLATNGAVGAVCRAVGDGSVVRMRMSPFGYGKALYIQQDGGPLVVYAHLSRFAAPMAARARAEQRRLGRYTFDLSIPAGEMRVRTGEIVAWSGQTGVGVPHLHFELRDGDVARNPQTAGFAVRDRIAPTLSEVRVVPLDAASHVQGGTEGRILAAGGAPLAVAGRLGFTVRASDRAAADGHRQAPYRMELRVDGQVLYRVVQERFDYADNHHLILEYDQERLRAGERVQRLYRRPGNRLPGRQVAAGTDGVLLAAVADAPDATLQVGPGPHSIEIEVADVAGQVTQFRAPIRVAPRPRVRLSGVADGAGVRWVCEADAPGGGADSLRLALDASRDGGRTWSAVPVGPAAADATAGRRWSGELAAAPQVLRARVHDRGVAAMALWAPQALPESEAPLAVEIVPRFEPRGWLQVAVEPEAILFEPPDVVAVRRDGTSLPLVVETIDARRYRATAAYVELAPDVVAIELRAHAIDGRRAVRREPCRTRIVRRGDAARIDDLDSGVAIDVPAGAALEDLAWRVRPARPPAASGELAAAGPAWDIEPRGAALDRAVRLTVAGAPTSGVGLFAIEPDAAPRFLSATRDADGALVHETRSIGVVAVLADTTPPVVRGLRVVPRGTRPQRLRCVVTDGGADLGDGDITVELDGAAAIPEWDPETGDVVIEPDARLAAGTHRLRVVAVDRVGNRTEKTLAFRVH
jgi:hypothetical protein